MSLSKIVLESKEGRRTIWNCCKHSIRVVEERSGRGKVSGPLHDFPLKRGESVTIFRRKGVRLRWRWDK